MAHLQSNLILKRARIHHLDGIKEIIDHKEVTEAMGFTSISWYEDAMRKHQVWIIEEPKFREVLAVIWFRKTRNSRMQVVRLAVKPGYQGKGLGTYLVNHFTEGKNTYAKIMKSSIPFWKKLGFQIVKSTNNPRTILVSRDYNKKLEQFPKVVNVI